MKVYQYKTPPVFLIVEENYVEVIDLLNWRMIPLKNAFARDFLDCLAGADPETKPVLQAVKEFGSPAHGILFQLLKNKGSGSKFESATLDPAPPWQLWLELTRQCNLKCIHCYAESSPSRDEHLAHDLAVRLVREAAEMKFSIIQFTGGDPLLYPSLEALAELAAELGIPTREVYTNGIALEEGLQERLIDLEVRFAISFYSHNSQHHDHITRVQGSHGQTLKAIRSLLRKKAHFRIAVILMSENRGDMAQTVSFLQSLGVAAHQIHCDVLHSVGRGRNTEKSPPGVSEAANDLLKSASPPVSDGGENRGWDGPTGPPIPAFFSGGCHWEI